MTATTFSGGTESTLKPVETGRTTNNSTPPAAVVLRSADQTMNVQRTATIVVVSAVLVAWLAGAASSLRPVPPPIITTPRAIDMRGIELNNEIARLHDRLRPTTPPNERRRNLFAFRAAPVAVPLPAPDVRAALPAAVEAVPQNADE